MSPRDATTTRPSLLARIQDPCDGASWGEFVEAYAPVIYQYGRRKGLQDADAADLTQEVLAEVARCIRAFEYRPERGRFRDWLGILAHRRFLRLLRKDRFAESTGGLADADPDGAGPSSVDPEWIDEQNAQILRTALERARPHFEPATWTAFTRVWLDGRAAAEVAAELGLPIEKVYVAKSRVLRRLEGEVRDLLEDLPQLFLFG